MKDGANSENHKPLSNTIGALPTWLVWLVCSATVLIALERGYEGEWYKLSTMIHHPETANPAFGYRLLFPFLAAKLEWLVPSLTDHNSFIATQIVAIAVTIYLAGKWTSLFLPRFGRLFGFSLTALILCPTLNYWTFYDIAITGFWTACLLLLYYQRPISYLLVFALATLNHENNLLLIPCAVLYLWGSMKIWKLVLFTVSQVVAWGAIRYFVISTVHAGPLFDNRLQYNLTFWRSYSLQLLFFSGIILIPWWLVACKGWKYAPRILRIAAISFPCLILVTILFGKFDESRQFDAFIPTCVGLIACWVNSLLQDGRGATDSGSRIATSDAARAVVTG